MYDLLSILSEGATIAERREINSLTESHKLSVNNSLITKLYNAAKEKSNVDFEHIPDSKGDITKYHGYKNMIATIEVIKGLAKSSDIEIKQLGIVEDAINNLIRYRDLFEKGFALDKDFVILLYNTLVYACLESISLLVSSYVDFIKRPDKIEFTLLKLVRGPSSIALTNLEEFNLSVKKGEFSKTINYILTHGKENLLGGGELIIPALLISGVVLLVPVIREIIFYFYYSRMKISDFLKQQAALLELNKAELETNSSISPNKKKQIIDKQQSTIKTLIKMSDAVKVDHSITDLKSSKEIKDENSSWKLKDMLPGSTSDNSGLQLL